jgi:hypothetical protein
MCDAVLCQSGQQRGVVDVQELMRCGYECWAECRAKTDVVDPEGVYDVCVV